MTTWAFSLVLIIFGSTTSLALAPDDLLNSCLSTIKKELHSKTSLPMVRVSSCGEGKNQAICHGYASSKDGGSTDDFVFGLKDDCKLSFYRVSQE